MAAYDSIFGYVPPATGAASVSRAAGTEPDPTGWPVAPATVQGHLTAPVRATTPAATPYSYTPPAPVAPSTNPLAAAAYGGLQAGAPAAAAYDTKSGVISTLGAGASGAAAGAVVGGPVGAVVGGGLGLLTGGLNAYLSVGKTNKDRRNQNKLLAEAAQKQAARDKLARDDALSQQAYDRGETARQQRWAKNLQVRDAIKGLIDDGTIARDRYVKTGRV